MALQEYLKQDSAKLCGELRQLLEESTEHMERICEDKVEPKQPLNRDAYKKELDSIDKAVDAALAHQKFVNWQFDCTKVVTKRKRPS